MKKTTLKSSVLASMAALAFSFSALQKGELTDIAKPYLGVYDCTQANLGDEDLLTRFEDLKLELKDKGEYVLYFKEKGGKTKKVKGKYRYDKEKSRITLRVRSSRILQREFPLEKGVLSVTVPYGEKTLCLQFEQK